MSFLVGPLSGAVVAGGIYYGFSNLITKRTEQHQKDLHRLTLRLSETPTYIQAPPPASSRIHQHDFSTTLKNTWNQEVAFIAAGFSGWGRELTRWGTEMLEKLPKPDSSLPAASSTVTTSTLERSEAGQTKEA